MLLGKTVDAWLGNLHRGVFVNSQNLRGDIKIIEAEAFMEIKLTFKLSLINNEVETQEITAPAVNDPNISLDQQRMLLMQRMLNQYTQVGMLRQPEKNKFILLCPSQIAFIECELPSVLIASPLDIPPSPRGGLVSG